MFICVMQLDQLMVPRSWHIASLEEILSDVGWSRESIRSLHSPYLHLPLMSTMTVNRKTRAPKVWRVACEIPS